MIEDSFELEPCFVEHRSSILRNGTLITGGLIPAVGYKLIYLPNNVKLAFSGDTGPTENLTSLFADCDVGFIEATHPGENWIKDTVKRFHLTENEAIIYTKDSERSFLTNKLPNHLVSK